MHIIRIGIVGDFNRASPSHSATDSALVHAAGHLGVDIETRWLPTDSLTVEGLERFDALWIAPGGPYRNMSAVLNAIRFARENGVPLLGTCGGFQQVAIEYARHVLGWADALHAEYDPGALAPFVAPLTCSLAGQRHTTRLQDGSRTAAFYGHASEVEEEFRCHFGLNPSYQDALDRAGLRIVGTDIHGQARVLELPPHPFFVATLFVPQMRSTPPEPHPLILSFVRVAVRRDV